MRNPIFKHILLFTLICFTPTLWSAEPLSIPKQGKLGTGFGEITEITGTIVDTRRKADSGKKMLQVQSVDGKNLETSVFLELHVFRFTDIKIPARGAMVKLRGYETGGFRGIPNEAFKDIPRVATTDFQFNSSFQVTKRIK